MNRLALTLIFCLSLAASAKTMAETSASQKDGFINYGYEILLERSHKKNLFTQGLIVDGEHFYESSGLYRSSLLVSYPVAEPASTWAQVSAKYTRQSALPPQYFAEGLTLFNNKLYLLTWREETLLIYNRETFALEKMLPYRGQGWGLTHDSTHLIRSDGSHQLTFHDPDTFKPLRVIEVFEQGMPLSQLNELEYINGKIWANIWYQNRLVEIDPQNGQVTGQLDLTKIIEPLGLTPEQVLNGIAYDETQQALWITGKFWPKMYLLRLQKK